MRTLIDYIQFKKARDLDKITLKVKYSSGKSGEVIIFDNDVFIIEDSVKKEKLGKGKIGKEGDIINIQESSLTELEKFISMDRIPKNIFLKEKTFESLKQIFGKDVEILMGY